MIEYYDQLPLEEQEAITEVIQLLYRQTFFLEKKYKFCVFGCKAPGNAV